MSNVPDIDERIHTLADEVYLAQSPSDIRSGVREDILELADEPELTNTQKLLLNHLGTQVSGTVESYHDEWVSLTGDVIGDKENFGAQCLAATIRHHIKEVVS
jgi:hypothetical protein